MCCRIFRQRFEDGAVVHISELVLHRRNQDYRIRSLGLHFGQLLCGLLRRLLLCRLLYGLLFRLLMRRLFCGLLRRLLHRQLCGLLCRFCNLGNGRGREQQEQSQEYIFHILRF